MDAVPNENDMVLVTESLVGGTTKPQVNSRKRLLRCARKDMLFLAM